MTRQTVPAHPPLPTYDWDSREQANVFPWLVSKARQVRAERNQAVMLQHEIRRNEHMRSNRALDHETEIDDRR